MKQWLKGALHTHTDKSDGSASPQYVLEIYKNCGYDFVVFTDHCTNYDPKKYIVDSKDMVVIGGVELSLNMGTKTDDSEKDCRTDMTKNDLGVWAVPHVNSLGVYGTDMTFDVYPGDIAKSVEKMIDAQNEHGGIPMVNHPNWLVGMSYWELLKINRKYLMEVGNCWDCCMGGNFARESMETIWDILLSKGKEVYAASTDDAHDYLPQHIEAKKEHFNKGYVSVYAEKNEKDILSALRHGDFYASTGTDLEEYKEDEKGIYVRVKPFADEKYIILFKGRMGIPLKEVYGTEAYYEFTGSPDEEYVRAKVVSNAIKDHENHFNERWTYYKSCYTQPYFPGKGKFTINSK